MSNRSPRRPLRDIPHATPAKWHSKCSRGERLLVASPGILRMHRYPPSIHEQARARTSRRRALVLAALAAAAFGSDLIPGAPARSHAAGLAFTAADAPRTDRSREQKA